MVLCSSADGSQEYYAVRCKVAGRWSPQSLWVPDRKSVGAGKGFFALLSVGELEGLGLKSCVLSHIFPRVGALFK